MLKSARDPVSCIQISGTIVYAQANQSLGEPLELILILYWRECNFTWHSWCKLKPWVSSTWHNKRILWFITRSMDTFFHNLVISALRFPVSIITNDFLDFSWDDCNTQETLETTVTVCKIWGGKQGASRFWWKWSIHFNGRTSISLSFKKCDK